MAFFAFTEWTSSKKKTHLCLRSVIILMCLPTGSPSNWNISQKENAGYPRLFIEIWPEKKQRGNPIPVQIFAKIFRNVHLGDACVGNSRMCLDSLSPKESLRRVLPATFCSSFKATSKCDVINLLSPNSLQRLNSLMRHEHYVSSQVHLSHKDVILYPRHFRATPPARAPDTKSRWTRSRCLQVLRAGCLSKRKKLNCNAAECLSPAKDLVQKSHWSPPHSMIFFSSHDMVCS